MTEPGSIAAAVHRFWFEEAGPAQWFNGGSAFDAAVRDRFGALSGRALAGALDGWLAEPVSAVALVLVLDQFPRNVFRGQPQAFGCDERCLVTARAVIALGHDRACSADERKFLYMPFMHSEALADQERCCELMRELGDTEALDYAERHLAVIRDFGRFPHRNAILGRSCTAAEEAYLQQPGAGF